MLLQNNITEEQVWDLLREVPDPEVPVISVVELGVVRNVLVEGESLIVTITPTYSGCPAMKVIEDDIVSKLQANGISQIKVNTVFKPSWTTDWLTEDAKLKLKKFGIAPPEKVSAEDIFPFLKDNRAQIACPRCNSLNTEMKSRFGSTACKALHYCNDCKEPFEYFKCI